MCVCVCVFSSHPFWTSSSLDVPAGVTQEDVEKLRGNFVEAHTLPIRAECSVKEQSWNILYDSPASVI